MKYNDSIKQANKKMTLVVELLQKWSLPADPIHFAVSYAFVSKSYPAMNKSIFQQINANKTLDEFFIEDLYQRYILKQNEFREDIVSELDEVLAATQKNSNISVNSMQTFIKKLDSSVANIQSKDQQQIQLGVKQIKQAADTLKIQQQKLANQLLKVKKQSNSLRAELDEVRQKMFVDPLTGLYNRKAMGKHIDTWFKNEPNKQIAAIVMNVDNFDVFNQKFGLLIGNVVLSKVAQKISSYVNDSGFPVRTGGDEFFILLTDVQKSTAAEIADKIKNGIKKLCFKSSKTGVSLPKINISLAIDEIKNPENIDLIIQRSRQILQRKIEDDEQQIVIC